MQKSTRSTTNTTTHVSTSSFYGKETQFSKSMITYGKKGQHEMSTDIPEQREDDKTKLIDLNLAMFTQDGEEVEQTEAPVQEEVHSKTGERGFGYTFNWTTRNN